MDTHSIFKWTMALILSVLMLFFTNMLIRSFGFPEELRLSIVGLELLLILSVFSLTIE